MNKAAFFKKIKEAEQHYYENSPCHHCYSGNGCDDCRGCKEGEIDVQMRRNVNKLKDEYKEKFGVDYNEELRELTLKNSEEIHKKKLLKEVWKKCSLLEILNAGGYDYETIKDNGYRWNPDKKILEKLPDPIFKIGQIIKLKGCPDKNIFWCISDIKNNQYIFNNGRKIDIDEQHHYELASDKFDISTLKPFKSRVLVRDTDHYEWEGAVFGRYDGNSFFTIGGVDWKYCIPYEGNEHLYGKTDDCNNFYKIWKE